MGKQRDHDSQVRLRPEFVQRCDVHGWPNQATFALFFRKTLGRSGSVEHQWRPLRLGEAVDREIADGFMEYVRGRWGPDWQATTLESASVADPSDADDRWFDWHSVVRTITDKYRAGKQHYFGDPPKDAMSVARMAMAQVGRWLAGASDPLAPEACLERGQAEMGRSCEELAQWIYGVWKHDYRCVMYATRQSAAARARRLEPIGATVLLPLTKEAFQKLHDGVIGDAELTPSDLAPTSSYIFPQLVTDIGAGNDLTASEISESQIHNIMYQAAYFTRGLRPARPTVLAFAATPQLHERLRRHGYHDVGRCLRGTDNPLLCLRPPEKQRGNNWKDHVCYDMFLLAIKPYSLSNAAEWKEEDRLKG